MLHVMSRMSRHITPLYHNMNVMTAMSRHMVTVMGAVACHRCHVTVKIICTAGLCRSVYAIEEGVPHLPHCVRDRGVLSSLHLCVCCAGGCVTLCQGCGKVASRGVCVEVGCAEDHSSRGV